MPNANILGYVLAEFGKLTKEPEDYLSVQDNAASNIREITKDLYDFTKQHESQVDESSALNELIIEEFDEEQIWQQIELQNESVWSHFLKNVSFCVAGKNKLIFPIETEQKDESVHEEDEVEEMDCEEPEPVVKKSSSKTTKKKKRKKVSKPSAVDDKFFKLGDLETFLNNEDKKEMNSSKSSKSKQRNSSDDDDEESIDYFEDMDSDEMEDMEDDGGSEDDRPKYKDFFDNPDGTGELSDEGEDGDEEVNREGVDYEDEDNIEENDGDSEIDIGELALHDGNKKKVRFNLQQGSDTSNDNSDSDGNKSDFAPQKNEAPSTFQLRQERLSKKIHHLENNMLSEKPWQMKGEVNASGRPLNSLLEEIVDFDLTSRPAPIITEETMHKLEDVITQRIKDKAWDDVERKAKPSKDPLEFKKAIVLDQEKSKLSLAQVYEKEFVKQRDGFEPDHDKTPDEPKEHKIIREMMKSLLSKLDAISNYHYTPKPAVPEVRIVSNIPAINMEEVAPVATSDAALLAPEEIKRAPKGDVIGKSERTNTDKKRERRKKKLKQKEREKERQRRETEVAKSGQTASGSKKINIKEKNRLLKSVTKARNVSVMKPEKNKGAKSFKL